MTVAGGSDGADLVAVEVNAMKGAYVGSAVGVLGGLYLGYARNNNNPGWNMLGWAFVGSWSLGALGFGVGSLTAGKTE